MKEVFDELISVERTWEDSVAPIERFLSENGTNIFWGLVILVLIVFLFWIARKSVRVPHVSQKHLGGGK